MKVMKWFTLLFLLILTACGSFNNRGLIEKPQVMGTNTTSIEVEMIEVSDTATVLHVRAFAQPKTWIRIASGSFLRDKAGGTFALRAGDGIVPDKEFWMPESGDAGFNLIFQPIPATATYVDFSEGDNVEGAFKIWGIQLSGKPLAAPSLPKGFIAPVAKPEDPLPAVSQKAGIAHFNGQLLNYMPDMAKEIDLIVFYPFGTVQQKAAVDEAGKFSAELDAFSPHPLVVNVLSNNYLCFIAPGETSTLIINPTELARRKSHLHKADPKIGEAAYFGGYLASLSQEIADEDLLAQLQRGNYNTQQEYNDFIDSFTDKTIAQAKEILQKKHDDKSAAIDATTYSAACKELLHIANDLTFFSGLSNTKTYMVYAYSIQHKIGNDQAALNKYAATITYPTDFYAPIKQLKYVNAPERCYSLLGISYPIGKAEIASCLGTDKGFLFDDMNASEAYRQLVDYQLLNNARLATVPESYLAYMQKKNDELAKKIEASKNKGGYEVKEISPDVAGKDILPQIIAQYKGKPIMIDIWGTWCNPCKIANKALAPVKEELKDKDIVYVFIAGENSPKDTWNIMITDLHGVHYRLTDKQWSDILSANESAGVPAYFYIDKTGKIVDKQIGFGGVEPMKKQLLEISK